jgi:hypothetical protein
MARWKGDWNETHKGDASMEEYNAKKDATVPPPKKPGQHQGARACINSIPSNTYGLKRFVMFPNKAQGG